MMTLRFIPELIIRKERLGNYDKIFLYSIIVLYSVHRDYGGWLALHNTIRTIGW